MRNGRCYGSKEVERKRKGKDKEENEKVKFSQEAQGQKAPKKNKPIIEEMLKSS